MSLTEQQQQLLQPWAQRMQQTQNAYQIAVADFQRALALVDHRLDETGVIVPIVDNSFQIETSNETDISQEESAVLGVEDNKPRNSGTSK
jgi:hypothetical protein